jgi:hypothetical protein
MDVQDSGNLDQKAFLTLLVELHRKEATGSLKLERAPLQKAVYFRDGQILFAASNDPQDQLASILVEEGKLSKDQMQVAQARVSAGNPLAKVLTELGYISQRELADAARLKVEKILTDLYGWKEGSFQFVERSLPKGAIDLELSTPRLLLNSVRRIQEREWVLEQLGSLDSVLSATTSLDDFLAATKPEPSAGEVLRLVDGVKSIKQIGAVSALGEFEVCKILAAALLSGALEEAAAGAPVPQEEIPSAPPVSPPTEAALPFSEDSVAETTALNLGEGGIPPPPEAVSEPPPPPVPLEEAEKAAPPPGRPAADFVFDEPPLAESAEQRRMPPRPKKMRRGGGEGSKKVLVVALVLAVVGASAGAAYYFLWPQGPSAGANGPSATTAPPDTAQATPGPKGPSPTVTPPPSTTAPPTTAPPPAGPTPTSPSSTRPPQSNQQTPGGTTQPPKATSTPSQPTPSPTSPRPPTTRPPSTGGQPLAQGRQQLKSGNYPQAAATFLGHLRRVGTDKFTIAVGVFCDTSNVTKVVKNSGGSEELLLLAFQDRGRSCYRVFWGIFDSRAEAQRALGSVPAGVRARDSAPVPIGRLIP